MIITYSQLHAKYWCEITLNSWRHPSFASYNRNWAALFLQTENRIFKFTTTEDCSNLRVQTMLDELLDPSRYFVLKVVNTTSQSINTKITTTKHSNLDSVIQELRSILLLDLL